MYALSECSEYCLYWSYAVGGLFAWQISQVEAGLSLQIPTGSVPTVTGTPVTGLVIVLDNEQGYANVRFRPWNAGL